MKRERECVCVYTHIYVSPHCGLYIFWLQNCFFFLFNHVPDKTISLLLDTRFFFLFSSEDRDGNGIFTAKKFQNTLQHLVSHRIGKIRKYLIIVGKLHFIFFSGNLFF